MGERRHRSSRSRSPSFVDRLQRRRSPDRPGRKHGAIDHVPQSLPHNARILTKHDLRDYRPMFALYLDIQKNLDIEELAESEVKGRWKSFINKWNFGELANGWYDPATLAKAINSQQDLDVPTSYRQESTQPEPSLPPHEAADTDHKRRHEENEEDEDDYGPSLPHPDLHISSVSKDASLARSGPTIPNIQDLQSRDEDNRVAAKTAWTVQKENDHYERKQENKSQRERLEDLVPRAAAGTRDRQIEKKQDIAASNRAFAASKDADVAEVQDRDLMGEDTMSELKKLKREQEKRKTEREIRREEVLRARTAEREERVRYMREKEDKTMSMLREIARERFGDGNVQPATLKSD